MRTDFKHILSSALFIYLVCLVVVQCASHGTEQRKFKKSVQSVKKSTSKKIPVDASEYGSTYRLEASINEAQPQLRTVKTKDRDFHWPSVEDKGKNDAAQARSGINRLKRSDSYVYPESGKQISNNYKKAKLAEFFSLKNEDKKLSKSKSRKKYHSNDEENAQKARRLKRDAILGSTPAQRPHANASDYYAQRKAVMERYYARQRQISQSLARYSTTTATTSNNTSTQISPGYLWTDANVHFDHDVQSTTAKTIATTNDPHQGDILTVNLLNYLSNDSKKKAIDPGESVISLTRPNDSSDNYEPDGDNYLSPSTTNTVVEREVPSQCDNVPRSGSYPSKRQNLPKNNCPSEESRGDMDENEESPKGSGNGTNSQQWGTCAGKIVYQHNLLLTITGPSNLDSRFEVAIQAPICITCVESIRYNDTRAMVSLESGGRGYEFLILRLIGFENEGFSYIIKVWGVKKTGNTCPK